MGQRTTRRNAPHTEARPAQPPVIVQAAATDANAAQPAAQDWCPICLDALGLDAPQPAGVVQMTCCRARLHTRCGMELVGHCFHCPTCRAADALLITMQAPRPLAAFARGAYSSVLKHETQDEDVRAFVTRYDARHGSNVHDAMYPPPRAEPRILATAQGRRRASRRRACGSQATKWRRVCVRRPWIEWRASRRHVSRRQCPTREPSPYGGGFGTHRSYHAPGSCFVIEQVGVLWIVRVAAIGNSRPATRRPMRFHLWKAQGNRSTWY